MNKKAITPLIATILLIGLTVSVTGLVIYIGEKTFLSTAEFSEEQSKKSKAVLDTNIKLINAEFIGKVGQGFGKGNQGSIKEM